VRRRALLLVALAAFVLVPSAAAGLRIRQVDTSGYPTIGVTMVSSKASHRAPSVAENGTPVSALDVENLGQAKSIVLAIDRSQSMEKGHAFDDALAGARAFIRAQGAFDRVSVVAFGSHAQIVQPFAQNGGTDSFGSLKVDSKAGTALYDGIVLAADSLAKEQLLGRVIVVLTDGTDVSSNASLGDAIAAARKAGALVYPIGIVGAQFDPKPLQQLAAQTGGRYTSTSSTKALRAIYTSIAAELGRTWHASYLTGQPQGTTLHLQAQLVGAGAATATAHLSGRASSTTAASPLIPSFLYGMFGSILLGLILTGLLAFGIWSMRQAKERTWVQARLAPHIGEKKQRRIGTRERLSAAAAIFTATEHALGNMNLWKRLSRTIERADIPLRTVEFVYVMAGAGFGLGIFLAVLGQAPGIILLGMLLGAFVPYGVLTAKVKKRLASFETQLPDLLVTMAASLKAGHSFKQGMQAVVDENRQPASDEFRRVLTETSLGRPMDDALKEMAERIGSSNFEFVITAVTIQRQVGGSMAELFDMVAETVRQRQQFARKIKALTSMGRMSAYVLVGLPFFMAFFITIINPTYMEPLYSTGIGHFLIFLSLAGMVVGSLLLKKIVSFRG
jgi:tight adherence protein B